MEDIASRKSSPLLIAVAWAIVVIPTIWGLNYTVKNALKLFTVSTAKATAQSAVFQAPPILS